MSLSSKRPAAAPTARNSRLTATLDQGAESNVFNRRQVVSSGGCRQMVRQETACHFGKTVTGARRLSLHRLPVPCCCQPVRAAAGDGQPVERRTQAVQCQALSCGGGALQQG